MHAGPASRRSQAVLADLVALVPHKKEGVVEVSHGAVRADRPLQKADSPGTTAANGRFSASGSVPREPASEAGGRVGVGPGLLRRPPSSESHGAHSSSRLAPMTPTPGVPALNLAAGTRAHPTDRTRPGRYPRSDSPSRRRWARRVLGRHGVGPFGAWPAHPASPGSRGCRQRSANARWRRSRSSPPCPRAGCKSG